MSAGRRTLAVATALAAVGIAVAVGAVARQSDAEPARVLAVTPADGTALAATPDQVTLRLSTDADPVLSHVTVRDSAGATVNDGRVRTDGQSGLRQPVRLDRPGDYSVAYHVTFTNGQDDTGVLRFSVGTGVPPRATGEIPDAITDSGEHAHGVDPLGATLLIVDGLVLLGVLVLLMRRRPSGPSHPATAGTPTPAGPTASGPRDRGPSEPPGD
ncbi:copper resistance CopC family protein [Micromonospora coxensis]|uniref:copper resistance CopC family protein n=1 Tax=Micromonospora coxensis TaxID=356852 RepID=UPI0012FE7CA5|nr:copper resistance CopC family protein [Micromonospora coxensis]